jgi:voltage-gated sodium channel
VYDKITSRSWFETFVMLNILLIAVATGVDLENETGVDDLVKFTQISASLTLGVFTLECVLKVIAEGLEPWVYFTDIENGYYNTFDFLIVAASYAFMDSAGSTISILRMLRLVRLLTFIKNVPQLRMIVAGLIHVSSSSQLALSNSHSLTHSLTPLLLFFLL